MNRFLISVTQRPPKASMITAPTVADLPHERFDLLESALHISSMRFVTPMWLQYAARAFAALPYIVAGIEHVHGDAIAGTEKKNLAMEALGLSFQVVSNLAPEHAPVIAAATNMAGNAINDLVALMKASGEAPKGLPPMTIVPAK